MAVIKSCSRRLVVEEGIVLSKIHKPASEAWEKDGKVINAQPERWIVLVASSHTCDGDTGFEDVSILEFPVDKSLYDYLAYSSPVKVKFEVTQYGSKPDSIEPLKSLK